MWLNGDKCQFLLTESSRTMWPHTAEIKIGDKYVEERKLLGILFDNNLTMVDHIKYGQQTSSKLYALARISHFLNDHNMKVLMKFFIIFPI